MKILLLLYFLRSGSNKAKEMNDIHILGIHKYTVCKYFLLLSPIILIFDYFRAVGLFSLNLELLINGSLSIINPLVFLFLDHRKRYQAVINYTLCIFFFLLLMIYVLELKSNTPLELTWIVLIPFAFVFLGDRLIGLLLSAIGFISGFVIYAVFAEMDVSPMISLDDLILVQSVYLVSIIFSFIYESSRQVSEEKIIRQVELDPLTGIANRRGIQTVLNGLTQNRIHGKDEHPVCSIILFDIDDFKSVNDMYGHDQGDQLLIEISRLAKKNLRPTDTLGRWGGEEFMVILPKTTLQGASVVAEHLRYQMSHHDFELGQNITASFGIASHKQNEDMDTLFKRADERMYHSKESGKDRISH